MTLTLLVQTLFIEQDEEKIIANVGASIRNLEILMIVVTMRKLFVLFSKNTYFFLEI